MRNRSLQLSTRVMAYRLYYYMNFFRQIKNFLTPTVVPPVQQTQPLSTSFELIVSDILEEPPSEDFVLMQEGSAELIIQEGIENMYVKDFFLIGKRCQGRALTVEEWESAILNGNLSSFSMKDLYFSLFQGIDDRVRKQVWQVLANTSEMKKQTTKTFADLSNASFLPAGEQEAIRKDVVRTGGVTNYLNELTGILVAYVNLSGRRYTQGMNLIGGVLLRLLSTENDKQFEGNLKIDKELAQRAFWVFVGVMQWKRWADLFEADLSGLKRMLGKLRELMVEHVPKVLELIKSLQWDLGIFAQYYVTISLYNCPSELASLILDLFLLDGENIIHSLLLRMLVLNQQRIMAFEDEMLLMRFLKKDMLGDAYHQLILNRANAKRLQDFQINFLRSAF